MKRYDIHPENFCQRCGLSNPIWHADNESWNTIMGGEGGIVCPNCFQEIAREKFDRSVEIVATLIPKVKPDEARDLTPKKPEGYDIPPIPRSGGEHYGPPQNVTFRGEPKLVEDEDKRLLNSVIGDLQQELKNARVICADYIIEIKRLNEEVQRLKPYAWKSSS